MPGTVGAESASPDGPVVVGGLGGSATRVFARLLQLSGHAIGADLNESLDHLGFTLLCKGRLELDTQERWAPAALRLVERATWSGGRPTPEELASLRAALSRVLVHGHDHLGSGRGIWALRRAWRLWRPRPAIGPGDDRWGFKEPNSHLFLPALAAQFPAMRYIYVLRHGLDMAFSDNLQQLRRWGPALGVAVPSSDEHAPVAQLAFWVAAAERAQQLGEELLGERFCCVRYDELTETPAPVLDEFADFLDVPRARLAGPEVEAVTRPSASSGRWRRRDIGRFPRHLIEAVERLGFCVA